MFDCFLLLNPETLSGVVVSRHGNESARSQHREQEKSDFELLFFLCCGALR